MCSRLTVVLRAIHEQPGDEFISRFAHRAPWLDWRKVDVRQQLARSGRQAVHLPGIPRAAYGDNPYRQGFAPNRAVMETFVRYAHEQGYISRAIPIRELFVRETLDLAG